MLLAAVNNPCTLLAELRTTPSDTAEAMIDATGLRTQISRGRASAVADFADLAEPNDGAAA